MCVGQLVTQTEFHGELVLNGPELSMFGDLIFFSSPRREEHIKEGLKPTRLTVD